MQNKNLLPAFKVKLRFIFQAFCISKANENLNLQLNLKLFFSIFDPNEKGFCTWLYRFDWNQLPECNQ